MSNGMEMVIENLVNQIDTMHTSIKVPKKFNEQVCAIDHVLANDKSGFVSTLYDFMIDASCVSTYIETKNPTLNNIFNEWKDRLLNKDTNDDIPIGLTALSEQYYRERWRSSFLGLNIRFEDVTIGDITVSLPTKAWFVNGGALGVEDNGKLDGKKYFLNTGDDIIPFKSGKNNKVFIRKPFSMWFQNYPSPFLVRRGVLFNCMMKSAIKEKQADLVDAIIPYILKLQSGSDHLAKENLLPTEEELNELKNEFRKKFSKNAYRRVNDLIASLSYDTEISHLIPDLTKALDPKIVQSLDKDIMAGMGMIEFEGFSSSRQEAMMNPKVLVAEVTDAVKDWNELVSAIVVETLKRNEENIPKLSKNKVNVTSGAIETFLSDKMKDFYRTLSDRGLLSIQTTLEATTDLDYDRELQRREEEKENGSEEIMFPRQIMNQGNQSDEEVLTDRDTNTPEANNFTLAEEAVNRVLPESAKIAWYSVYNDSINNKNDQIDAINNAWTEVKKEYRKVPSVTVWEKI